MRYDRTRGSLDRLATYIVAAYIAGADQIFHGSGPLEDGAHGVGEVIC
jgi:hypothetical protein